VYSSFLIERLLWKCMLTDAEFFCAMNSSVQWELEVETSTRSCTIIPLETTNFSRLIALQCKLLRGARSVSYRRKPFSVPATKTLQEFLLGDYPTATGYPLWVTWIGSLTLAVQNVGASVALRAISLDHFSHEGNVFGCLLCVVTWSKVCFLVWSDLMRCGKH